MSSKTKIEWTEATWNPIRGCSRVSEGCRNCYAEGVANRFKGEGLPYEGLIAKSGQWNGTVKLIDDKLTEPFRWRKQRMIFVNSMSDLFHENLHIEYIAKIFAVMYLAHWHTFQVLTKRAERMHEILNNPSFYDLVLNAALQYRKNIRLKDTGVSISDPTRFPHKNVWMGVSVENQETANQRIPLLLKTPAATRWISAEPLLGPIDLNTIEFSQSPGYFGDALMWYHRPYGERDTKWNGIDWVVVGGESAPGTIGHKTNARPMHPDWARSLRDQCVNAEVPFFFKQWGNWSPHDKPPTPGKYNGGGIALKPNGSYGNQQDYWDGAAAAMNHTGKKKSGRVLDGRTWDEFPRIDQ